MASSDADARKESPLFTYISVRCNREIFYLKKNFLREGGIIKFFDRSTRKVAVRIEHGKPADVNWVYWRQIRLEVIVD